MKNLENPIHIRIQEYLDKFNLGLYVIELSENTKTCELAAEALNVEPKQIAKTLLFMADENPILVVTSGDKKVDSKKVKKLVGAKKVKFAPLDEVEKITGYKAGGVCPLLLPSKILTLIDISLDRFDKVYMAAGTDFSAIPITTKEIETITEGKITDVC